MDQPMMYGKQGAKKGRAAGRFYISQHRWASVCLRRKTASRKRAVWGYLQKLVVFETTLEALKMYV
jgi:hypothetical protein